jgi:hypothetical protein
MAPKTFSIKSSKFPVESASMIVDMLRGKTPFDKWKAIYAALELITFITSYAADTYSSKSVRAPKLSQKVIADALEAAIAKKKGGVTASSLDIPVWLLPILIKLLLKWIENNYVNKGVSDEKER